MPARQGAGATDREQAGRLQAGEVRAMFDRIARVYDAMNTAMTAGLHHRWRARAADLAHVGPGERVLDVATGTGDLAVEMYRRVAPGGEVVGCDFAEGMLDVARAKVARSFQAGTGPRFEWADALKLPYAEDSFDAATVGFGARNFEDLPRGLSEMARVVRPGGRVVVLEITTPTKPPLSAFYGLWFDRVVPAIGALVEAAGRRLRRSPGGSDGTSAGISDAYMYLPNSVKRFPGPVELAQKLHEAGLIEVEYLLTAGGIIAMHAGTVPREPRE